MCQPGRAQRTLAVWGCTCDCCGCGTFFRRFLSKEEEKERLEEYRDQLKKEIKGVEECIQELKRK